MSVLCNTSSATGESGVREYASQIANQWTICRRSARLSGAPPRGAVINAVLFSCKM